MRAEVRGQKGRLSAALVALVLTGACASGTTSLADRFVQRGKPATVINTPNAPHAKTAAAGVVPDELSRGPIPKTSDLPTLESENAELKAAIVALQAAPSAAAHRKVADAYFRLRVYDMSYRHYEFALRIDPRDAAAYDGLARVCRDWGVPGGLGHAYQAIALAPAWPVAHNTLGTLLFAIGKTADAVSRFEQALALDATAGYARRNLCYVATLTSDAIREQQYCGETR